MNKKLTELVFILDRSGSMADLQEDTIGGFNAMLEKQQALPGEALVSTVLFDHEIELLHDRIPIKDLNPLTQDDYWVRGSTALMDALGFSIRRMETVHKFIRPEDLPHKTLFIITTDGMENASRNFQIRELKEMILKKEEEGWEFLFLGANMDAIETARQYGIRKDRAVNYCCDSQGTCLNYQVLSDAVKTVRACRPLKSSWKKEIEQDFQKRKKEAFHSI